MHKHKRGFSLIELSIVLIVIGVIIYSGTSAFLSAFRYANYGLTQQQLNALQAALEAYYKKYNTYPCPARFGATTTDTDYQTAVATCEVNSTCTSGITCTSQVAFGAFPSATLNQAGITASTAIDQWGNKILYAVDRRFLQPKSATECTGAGQLTIRDAGSNNLTTQAVYAIFSTGKNLAGGYGANGQTTGSCLVGATESTNCGYSSSIFTVANYVENVGASNYYDDILLWGTNPNQQSCPGKVNGCRLWLDAADICTITRTGSTINSWTDKSPNATSVTITTTTGSPAFNTGGANLNGHSYVSFTGNGLISANYSLPPPFTVTVVFYPTSLSGTSAIFNSNSLATVTGGTASRILGISGAKPAYSPNGGASITGTTNFTLNTPYIMTLVTDGSNNFSVYSAGVPTAITGNTASTSQTYFNIGGLTSWGNYNGYILEVVVYDSVLSPFSQNAVETYLATKWGAVYNLAF